MAESTSKGHHKNPDHFKRSRYKSDSEFIVRKRLPVRPCKDVGDFYVTNKSDFKGQLKQCIELAKTGIVTIRGLGAALPKTVNLALQVQEALGNSYRMDVATSTVRLTDDVEGFQDSFEQKRDNSSIKVCFRKIDESPTAV